MRPTMSEEPKTFSSFDEMWAEMEARYNAQPWWHKLRIIVWRRNIRRLKDLRYKIKCNTIYRWQRGKRGWAINDTWGLDHYLADVIIGSVTHLRNNLHGYPGDDKAPTIEAWQAELDLIIAGFKAHHVLMDLAYQDNKMTEELTKQFDKGMEVFGRRFGYLWD